MAEREKDDAADPTATEEDLLELIVAGDAPARIDGMIVGQVARVEGGLLVTFPGQETPVAARALASAGALAVGAEVALMMDGGDASRPVVLGALAAPAPIEARVDGKRLVLEAAEEIVLSCGKASITLTRAGKILIRGAYISSRSTGAHRVRGASVEIN